MRAGYQPTAPRQNGWGPPNVGSAADSAPSTSPCIEEIRLRCLVEAGRQQDRRQGSTLADLIADAERLVTFVLDGVHDHGRQPAASAGGSPDRSTGRTGQ